MGLLERINAQLGRKSFSQPNFWSIPDWAGVSSTSRDRESIENDFASFVTGAYKGTGPVFAAVERRKQVFSQARFMWQKFQGGRPGDLFGSPELALLERPWVGGTTGELLARMEQDASLAGNFYATTVDDAGRMGKAATGTGRRISRMRPDWVTLVIGAPSGDPFGPDNFVMAYEYRSQGPGSLQEPVLLLPGEVVHYSPTPDPIARFRGMSWLTPVLREIMADRAATDHKLRFFENGAALSMVFKYPPNTTPEKLEKYRKLFELQHTGSSKAYRALHLAGADPVPTAMNFQQMDFKVTQGAGETRIATASGVPAAILGISEGLAGSSLNAGNFGAARRLFVDTTIRDLWGIAAPALETLLTFPAGATRLWYDDRDIPFLREDAKDNAEIRSLDALTIKAFVDAGYLPDAAVQFVRTGDFAALTGQHSGLFSVQLQPAGTAQAPPKGGTS
jgi:phage portal protein BeeE